MIVPPGFLVKVQVSEAGKPFNTTLPVATVQFGWVIVPIVRAVGVDGCALMTTLHDACEVQPDALVTVKLKVPVGIPEIVVLVPEPVIDPGLMVQVPEAGKPIKTTLPEATVQVGWVMVPIVGVVGVDGCALMTTLTDASEIQPDALVTV